MVHDITPESAGWGYVGFALHRLSPGDVASGSTRDLEAILVVVEGKLELTVGDSDFGEIGERMSVFEKTAPHCVLVDHHRTTAD